MAESKDLISHVLLPSTIDDLKRRLDSGQISSRYTSNIIPNRTREDLEKKTSDTNRKTQYSPKNGQTTLTKEVNNKCNQSGGNSMYVNSSNGENLTWDSLNKIIKDKVQCPDCGKCFLNEVKLPEIFLKLYANSIGNNVGNTLHNTLTHKVPMLPPVNEPQSFECSICDRVFSQKQNYANHVKKHIMKQSPVQKDKHKCDICGKTYSNQANLVSHFLEHKANTCHKCGKRFPDKWKYERHLKTHMHKCPVCEKLFVKIEPLKKHMANYHEGVELVEKQNPQKANANSFNKVAVALNEMSSVEEQSKALALAIIRHEELASKADPNAMAVVPFIPKLTQAKTEYKNVCTICGKAFRDKWKLKQHLVIHSGEKNFACNFCTQRFYFKYGLSRHVKNVHLSKESPDTLDLIKKENFNQLNNV